MIAVILACSLIVHLLSALNRGITVAFFVQFGKTHSENDRLHKIDNGIAIMLLTSLVKQANMPSSPGDLLIFNELISLKTFCEDVGSR